MNHQLAAAGGECGRRELRPLVLSNGSELRSVPQSERAVRGWSVDTLLIDEAA